MAAVLSALWSSPLTAQPDRPDRPTPPDPNRFVDHALHFDADGNGELSREELLRFAEDFAQGPERMRDRELPPDASFGPVDQNDAQVRIYIEGEFRIIEANGIPDHQTGRFPNRRNPNQIAPQHYRFRVPVQPQAAERVVFAGGMPFGIALNGIPFDPGTAELWQGNADWRYEALGGQIDLGLDDSNAHVQPNGAYHYHGLPHGLIRAHDGQQRMTLLGYAADGFPIYSQFGHRDADDPASELIQLRSSYQLKQGTRPGGNDGPGGKYDGTFEQDFEYVAGAGDLDECNGRFAVTTEYPDGTYLYVVTDEFPFIGRWFRGTPDPSFQRRGPGGLGGPGGPPGRTGRPGRPPLGR